MLYWKKQVCVYQYNSEIDYAKRKAADAQDISLSIADIIRYSVANASFKGRAGKSLGGFLFYAAPVIAALEPAKNARDRFGMSGIYEFAEGSFKASISFQLGMVAAHAVFEKLLSGNRGGCLLLHGKDSNSVKIYSDSEESPDFVGVDIHGPYALLEAKGSSKARVGCDKVDHAKEQLDIDGIVYSSGMSTRYVPSAQLSKHVVTSAFEPLSQRKDKILYFSDIDPKGEGDSVIHLDMQKAIANYYATVMNALRSDEYTVDSEEVCGFEYKIIRLGTRTKIGLMERLYQPLLDISHNLGGYVRESSVEELFGLLREYGPRASELRSEDAGERNLSLGPDGLLVEIDEDYFFHRWYECKHPWRFM
ncbi:MAG: hypothetical protein PUG40_05325 [Berryella intestinalis]|nr:hypothetical protein [Berryella intestinalis]